MDELFSGIAAGKVMMQEHEWKNMKCKHCGVKLIDDHSTTLAEFKVCPKCGKKHALIKKLTGFSVHSNCKYYREQDDICLLFFELTPCAFNVSKKSKKCLEKVIYDE